MQASEQVRQRWIVVQLAALVVLPGCLGAVVAAEGKRRPPRVVTSVALSGDGKRVLMGSGDKTARPWGSETGKAIGGFKGHAKVVKSVALSGDGKRVLTGSEDRTARLWDSATGKTIQTFKGHAEGVT